MDEKLFSELKWDFKNFTRFAVYLHSGFPSVAISLQGLLRAQFNGNPSSDS